jgi:hypothetical protein
MKRQEFIKEFLKDIRNARDLLKQRDFPCLVKGIHFSVVKEEDQIFADSEKHHFSFSTKDILSKCKAAMDKYNKQFLSTQENWSELCS